MKQAMIHIRHSLPIILLISNLLLPITGCTSTVIAAFNAIDPDSLGISVDPNPTLRTAETSFVLHSARDRAGGYFLWLECRRNAGMVLIAPISAGDLQRLFANPPQGQITGSFERLYQFYNWDNGWSEYEQNVVGGFRLNAVGDGWQLKVDSTIELLDFKQAAIRAGEKTWRGEPALTIMRNRSDRIDAIIAISQNKLPDILDPKGEVWSLKTARYPPTFKDDLLAWLVPEMVPAEKRPTTWKEPYQQSDYAESVVWNRDYSLAVFPSNLVEIRQSGTMLRDCEESLAMIYGRWRWQSSLALLQTGVNLVFELK